MKNKKKHNKPKQKKYPSGGVAAKSCSCENIPPQPESEVGCKRTIFE